ncbi:MAG: arginine--tRNA ligase [Candidatus Levybacteria bacterium RIFCSPHIGHO2_01_FULL_37_17]|nr:MAG: arginine--tRNA ligase [Candidatus Levybacteria bacterium RIFCSPHIGHO2_01_FULL_37_17]OGH36565.1 MAG: arginine--tRNA ligase [Candidatus Levybacteria bacterium RIFCSPLOWO2_01_FULL_38_23]
MMIKGVFVTKKLYSILSGLASEMGVKEPNFKVEVPKNKTHGDLSSNIALALAKTLDRNPMELAKEISEKLKIDSSLISKIEIAAPGFINFWFSQEYLSSRVQNIIKEDDLYGSIDLGKGKKASVEYVSANPTGPLHIGNARGGPLGDIIANIMQKAGYRVSREYLHNDIGGQVEKLGETIYYLLNPSDKPKDYELQYRGEYVYDLAKEVNTKLHNSKLSKEEFMKEAGKIAVEIMLEQILEDCKLMGINFDKITKESELRKDVSKTLDRLKNSLKENEGALWFAPSDQYLKDRETVVRKSNGEYTYFASDIVYHNQKLSENDIAIDVLGVNHSGHVPKLFAVAKALGHNPDSLKVVLYQFVRLKQGSESLKMSKREGTFVTAKEVLQEVGKDAFRFFLVSQNNQSHIDFDIELAKKRAAENPVFYVQYAYTRIASIFAKLKTENLKLKTDDLGSKLKEKEELELMRLLLQLPTLVETVAQNFAVNLITNYSVELATSFHRFYEKQQVLSVESELKNARLALLKATQITLRNTLDLLGISAPEKM